MKILILGGTGVMGRPLVQQLAKKSENQIYVTSRKEHASYSKNITYIKGDAQDDEFLKLILLETYDAIIDFMIYTLDEFKSRLNLLLASTKQYFFLSSSRVYAESDVPITEESPRLIDVCNDSVYLSSDEYALTKAREENVLMQSGYNNWTIIRPYITYNVERLQLGMLEKQHWLRRALEGKTIVFAKDVANHVTTMTYGYDVACGIVKLIGNEKAYKEVFNIVSGDSMSWRLVLKVYLDVIEETTGKRPCVHMLSDAKMFWEVLGNEYQVRYDRLYNREFDNSKFQRACDNKIEFLSMKDGLKKCLKEFLEMHMDIRDITVNPHVEAWMDRITKERLSLHTIQGWKNKVKYIGWRYMPHIMKIATEHLK